jgi:hypothetical protein
VRVIYGQLSKQARSGAFKEWSIASIRSAIVIFFPSSVAFRLPPQIARCEACDVCRFPNSLLPVYLA